MKLNEYLAAEEKILHKKNLCFKSISLYEFIKLLTSKNYNDCIKVIDNNLVDDQLYLLKNYLNFCLSSESANINNFMVEDRLIYFTYSSIPYFYQGYTARTHGLSGALLKKWPNMICVVRPGYPLDLNGFDKDDSFENIKIIDGIKYLFTQHPNFKRNKRYILDTYEYYYRLINILKPKISLIATGGSIPIASVISSNIYGSYSIFEARGFWEITRSSRENKFIGSNDHIRMIRDDLISCALSRKIKTLTSQMRELLISRGIPKNKISLMPNGYDPKKLFYKSRDRDLAKKIGIKDDDIVMGYLGSFVYYEGVELLPDTLFDDELKNLKNLKLLLVGGESESDNNKLITKEIIKKISNNPELKERIILTGKVPLKEINNYYSLFDILIYPRKSFAVTEIVSPIKPIEAAAMGKTIIMSDVAGMDNILDPEVRLIFKSDDINSLISAIKKSLNIDYRKIFSLKAKSWAEANRTWLKISENILNVN